MSLAGRGVSALRPTGVLGKVCCRMVEVDGATGRRRASGMSAPRSQPGTFGTAGLDLGVVQCPCSSVVVVTDWGSGGVLVSPVMSGPRYREERV